MKIMPISGWSSVTGTQAPQSMHSNRIDVELGDGVECGATVVIGRVLFGVDAIYGTGVDAGSVFRSDAGSRIARLLRAVKKNPRPLPRREAGGVSKEMAVDEVKTGRLKCPVYASADASWFAIRSSPSAAR